MGGYASLPASVAAVVLGVPLVLVNVDAVPGAANRLLGRFARASAVGWDGTPLPRAVVTGTPVRPEIAAVGRGPDDRRRARRELGLPEDRATVVVFGGSLGARRINQAAAGLATAGGTGATARSTTSSGGGTGPRSVAPAARRATGRPPDRAGPVRVPYQERMDLVYSRRRPGGVPGRRHDGGRAGGGRRALGAGAPAGGAGRPSDGQCPGPRKGRSGRPPARRRLRRRTGWPAARPAAGRSRRGSPPWGGPRPSLGRPDAAAAGAAVVEAHARPAPGAGGEPEWRRPGPLGPGAEPSHRARGRYRRRRYECHRHRPARHGPHRHRQRPPGLGGDRASAPRRGAGGHRPRGPTNVGAADVVTASSAVARRQSRAGRGPTPGHHRPDPGRGAVRHRRPQALHRRGRHPRQDHHRLDAGPRAGRGRDARPPSSSGAMSTRSAPTPCGTTATGWWSRPTRATALSCPSTPTSPWSPTSRPTISTTTAPSPLSAAFEEFVAGARHRRVVGGRRPGGRRHRPGRRRRHRRGLAEVHLPDGRPDPGPQLGVLRAGGTRRGRAGPSGRARPGAHNARNAAVATVAALAAGAPSMSRPGPWPASPAWPAASSSGATATGSPSSTTTPTSRARCAAALAAARHGDWRRVVAVFQPHRYSRTAELAAAVRPGLRRRRPGGGHRRLRRRRAPGARGDRRAGGRRHPTSSPRVPVLYAPGRAELRRTVAASSRPGDLCLTLGAGDLTSLPDELMADPSW